MIFLSKWINVVVLLIILQSNVMSLSNLRKFIQCYIRQSLIINDSTNFLFLSNLVRNWLSTTNKTHRIINTKSSSQILLIFEKFYTTHRVNICSWNIRGTFPWDIPRIFGKSSVWNSREYSRNNVPGILNTGIVPDCSMNILQMLLAFS